MDISILIANWNGEALLKNCIASIQHFTQGVDYEVIVVDDCSQDRSVEILRAEFPAVTVIVNQRNYGFAKTNNIGLGIARGKYVFLLNNDTVIRSNVFKQFVDFMESHPDVGICGGTLVNAGGSRVVSYGNFPSVPEALMGTMFFPELFPRARWVLRKAIIPPEDIRRPVGVDYISGAAFCIRSVIARAYGLFDESFEAYFEETDLCARVKKDGKWTIQYFPDAEIVHLEGHSYDSIPDKKIRTMMRSYILYLRKHHGPVNRSIIVILNIKRYLLQYFFHGVALLVNPTPDHRARLRELSLTIGFLFHRHSS